jgi:L-ribulokinase
VPKAMQIAKEAPRVYDATDRIIEAGDWMVWQLCGREVRSACNAGYKALLQHGYPQNAFFKELDPRLANMVDDKLSKSPALLCTRAGELTQKAAELTGLKQGTAVAVGIIDAHAVRTLLRYRRTGQNADDYGNAKRCQTRGNC